MFRIERTEFTGGYTAGVLFFMGNPIGFTIEPPWNFNRRNVSCIPDGAYMIERVNSPSRGDCLAVLDVPDRSGILIHAGNVAAESRGCILPGTAIGQINDVRAVRNSRVALSRILEIFDANLPGSMALVVTGIFKE